MCVPVPPMPPEVSNGNPAVPVCHMAQELYAMVELCVLTLQCDGPEAVGEFQDCHCSLQTTHTV